MIFGNRPRRIARSGYPVLTPIVRDLYRTKGILNYGFRPLARALAWYFTSREYTNFTYNISEKCKKYLANSLATILAVEPEYILSLFQEVEEDTGLRDCLLVRVPRTSDRYFADLPIKYGRRIGWYAVVRVLKPALIVEAGIDRGVGTCILAHALMRNAEEGFDGRVIGLDTNPLAGSYVGPPYATLAEIVYTDSLEFLQETKDPIDLFIHDSNHSAEHEKRELELVWPRLSPKGAIISDNAHVTDVLYDFARQHSLPFTYWQEEVVGHIAKPASIGIAVRGS